MKKKILSAIMICCAVVTIHAQEKNEFWTGGNVSVWVNKTEGSSSLTNVKILPEFGYQFYNNLGVGMQLGYVHGQNWSDTGKKMKSDGLWIAPYIRYSYLKGTVGNLFVDGVVGYGYNKYQSSGPEQHLLHVGLRPGVAAHITDNISLIGKIGFIGYQYDKLDKVKTHSGGLDLNPDQIEVGVIIRM